MGTFKIEGGHQLHGEITPQGAKNEALQILCAVLLTPETVTIHNIPDILDVVQERRLIAIPIINRVNEFMDELMRRLEEPGYTGKQGNYRFDQLTGLSVIP